eukprot:7195264-Ditylum_brightwellii.AAC.1
MGASKESYSPSELYPIYGSDQGVMNSTNIWLVISSILADIYDEEAHDAAFIGPDKQINAKLAILGLVDDSTSQVNEFFNNEETAQELALNMEQYSTLWPTLLWLSGGLLELS